MFTIKSMHGRLFQDEDNAADVTTSSLWLLKGNITPQQEGMYTKLQDRNLYFGGNQNKIPTLSPRS